MSTEVRLRCLEVASRFTHDPAQALNLAEAFEHFAGGQDATAVASLIEAARLAEEARGFGLSVDQREGLLGR